MKVLVIDDEPQIRRALRAGLERSNLEVLLAGSGEEGLDMAAINNPDVIILDLAMPGIDGYEVCK
ncbi:response regulator transcription factor, partial [Salmonella enterica]|uniref:response regulator transcription factor n=1 Tax=Salmonella enterica TaxID=28901 RepID=UPI003D2C6083